MGKISHHRISEILPSSKSVFVHQGIPGNQPVSERTQDLFAKAIQILERLCEPVSITRMVDQSIFAEIFSGVGKNDADAPLKNIFPLAEGLSLFAATLGQPVWQEISMLFKMNEFALAVMLDSTASLAVENIVSTLERGEHLPENHATLGYSPGYCGWHVSAQKKLFDFLEPGQIGIKLNDSFMMTPIKSCSGVLISGPKKIHMFKASFGFCSSCILKGCRDRIRVLRDQ